LSPCPLSRNLETCPFYITESKIGVAQGPTIVSVSLVAVVFDAIQNQPRQSLSQAEAPLPDRSEVYLRNRVLLI
jgi:hypothetical protein